jgi:5'-phosphate synthase pdxT subunit
MPDAAPPIIRTVGVLALQGDFAEHVASFASLARRGWRAVEVRTPSELAACSALVLPGGESTAQGLLAERQGLLAPLRAWVAAGRPVWGTCAGLVLLADRLDARSTKIGGQPTLSPAGGDGGGGGGGASSLDITVARNWFGAQKSSFEAPLELADGVDAAAAAAGLGAAALPRLRAAGVFIRAPAVLALGPRAAPLAWVRRPAADVRGDVRGELLFAAPGAEAAGAGAGAGDDGRIVVAVRQGATLGTAFHPEISGSTAWHAFFLAVVAEPALSAGGAAS